MTLSTPSPIALASACMANGAALPLDWGTLKLSLHFSAVNVVEHASVNAKGAFLAKLCNGKAISAKFFVHIIDGRMQGL